MLRKEYQHRRAAGPGRCYLIARQTVYHDPGCPSPIARANFESVLTLGARAHLQWTEGTAGLARDLA